MSLLRRLFNTLRRKTSEVIADVFFNATHHLLKQSVLIGFHRQNIIAFTVDDLFGDRNLSSHRINRDDGAIQINQFEKFRNCCDFIGFFFCRHLSKREAKLR